MTHVPVFYALPVDYSVHRMGITSLQQFPEDIISNIIKYLPQQDKINFLYTNFHFYQLVQPLLYRNLLFSKSSALKCPNSFDESLYTVIGGMSTPLATDSLNEKIFKSRQLILLDSLNVNIELTKYIENIIINGVILNNKSLESFEDIMVPELLQFLKSNCPNLKKFSTFNTNIQNIIVPSLTHLQLSNFQNFNDIINLQLKVDHLELKFDDNKNNLNSYEDNQIVCFFQNLQTLIFNDEISQNIVLDRLSKIKNLKLKLKTLKLIFYHNFDSPYSIVCSFLDKIDINFLKNLELVLGCNDITCDCLHKLSNYLINKNIDLVKLSLLQKTLRRDHNYAEAFDFLITEFLKNYPNHRNLKHLLITHMPPNDFNVDFGFEGNYLHRKKLFEDVLPLLTGLETFTSSTFLQSISCYEQLISNLLWNGCTCDHCDDYLPIFDKYVSSHQYYDEMKSHMTDMISPILFGNVATVLSTRLISESQLFNDSLPPLNSYWDFHVAPYEIQHFDNDCSFDKSAFPPATTCIVHFLQDYVDSIGGMLPQLRACNLSGVFFNKIDEKWICSES